MNWPTVRIAQFCQTGSGGTPSRSNLNRYYGGHIPWVKSGELLDGVLTDTEEHITQAALQESAARLVPPGAVLIAMYGATVGRTALLATEASTNQAVCHILPNPDLAIPKYVWFALRARLPELLAMRVGGAQPNISQQIVRNTRVALPPRSEQQRIVEILEQADALRRKRVDADAQAERVLPALFYKLFGDPATNPKGWQRTVLGEVATDLRYGTSERCSDRPPGLPVLRIPNVVAEDIDISDLKYAELPEEEMEKLTLQRGDLLFVRTNGNRDYVGRCAVFDLPDRYLFASYLISVRLDQDEADPWFVAACLRTPSGRSAMSSFIRTTAGQSNIGMEGLRSVPIFLPPVEDQRKFRAYVASLRADRDTRRQAAYELETLFGTVSHRAFSGELTARWREAHMQELLMEMEQQAKALEAV